VSAETLIDRSAWRSCCWRSCSISLACSRPSYPYTALNFAGASLAGFASYLIGFMPFVVLEGTWATSRRSRWCDACWCGRTA
jgi:hypothetical protein